MKKFDSGIPDKTSTVVYSSQVHLDMFMIQVINLFHAKSFVSWLIFSIHFKEYMYDDVAINVKSKRYRHD